MFLRNPQYRYRPLLNTKNRREIRLLELRSRPAGARLIRRIEHVALEGNPTFKAISYCWGDQEATEEVFCDEPKTSLLVTKNLKSALFSCASAKNAWNIVGAHDQRILVWAD